MAYLPLSTANLPDPVIDPAQGSSPEDYFNTVLYTGANPNAAQSITGVGFQPDFLWIKSRVTGYGHALQDAVRGSTKRLQSDTTGAESTSATYVSSFDSDGFSLGTDYGQNAPNEPYVAWNWKANGSGVSNTVGSIPSTVSANTESGFSIVSYSGDGAGNFTVGHGLDSAPEFVAVKRRDSTSNWYCWHEGLSSGAYVIYLNATNAQASEPTVWNSTAPTSSVFTIGTDGNLKTTGDYIAYCFHSVEGFSKFGSYTGNGSSDGVFVYTGFRPAFVLIKKSSASGDSWVMRDSARHPYNDDSNPYLYANLSNAEGEVSGRLIDFVSNGFKIRENLSFTNSSGATYIYMAFAENPFKYSNAR